MSTETDNTIMLAAVVIGGFIILQQQRLRQQQLNRNQTTAATYGGAATSVINALGNLFKGISGSSSSSAPQNPASGGYNPNAQQAGTAAATGANPTTGPVIPSDPEQATSDDGIAYNPPNASPYEALMSA